MNFGRRDITIGELEQDFYAQLTLWDFGNEYLEVTAYLYAPGRGEELLRYLAKEIQVVANTEKRIVKHSYQATNRAAKALVERKVSDIQYRFVDTTNHMDQIQWNYEKYYYPEVES